MLKHTVLPLLAFVVSCGTSSAELKSAREARYTAPPATLYAEVKAATESNYKMISSDDAALVLKTEGRWYTPDGLADTTRGNNLARLQENSINFSVIVRLVKADGDAYVVAVEPIALRLSKLSSKAEPLDMKDPTVPGWVHGKVDSLQLGIHERLKRYAVATVPAMVPPAPAPAAPADPSAAPPAAPAPAGSAAAPPPAP